MAYTKTTWATGDTITAEKLNHIEGGIAAAGAVLCTSNNDVLDMTYNDLKAAMEAGQIVIMIEFYDIDDHEHDYSLWICTYLREDNGSYTATFTNTNANNGTATNTNNYTANDPDGALVFS